MSEVEDTKQSTKADNLPAKKAAPKKKAAQQKGYAAVGRRKTAVARVVLQPGTGQININGKQSEEYVSGRHKLLAEISKPFAVLKLSNVYDVAVKATGGGIASQAEAIKLGIARALLLVDETMKPVLSKAGCLVRDSRMKERKKYGRKRARKSFQYTKR